MADRVTLEVYEHYFEAFRDKQLLEREGIFSYIANEYIIQVYWLLSQAVGGIKLRIFEGDVERARKILNNREKIHEEIQVEYYIENSGLGNKICPECSSNHIYRDEKLNGVFGLSILILGFPLKVKNRVYHCYYCNNKWKE